MARQDNYHSKYLHSTHNTQQKIVHESKHNNKNHY